jgi:hypothetical protein
MRFLGLDDSINTKATPSTMTEHDTHSVLLRVRLYCLYVGGREAAMRLDLGTARLS